MSQMDHSRRFDGRPATSGLRRSADLRTVRRRVLNVPTSDIPGHPLPLDLIVATPTTIGDVVIQIATPASPRRADKATLQISSWRAGDVYESLHIGSPPPRHKAAIVRYRSLNQATRRRRCRNTTSPLTKADAMGSRSFVCVQASIVAIRHRAKGTRFFSTSAQAVRWKARWTGPLRLVRQFRLSPSNDRTKAVDSHDGQTICDSPIASSSA